MTATLPRQPGGLVSHPTAPVLVDADPDRSGPSETTGEGRGDAPTPRPWWQTKVAPITPRRAAISVAAWLLVTLLGVVLVVYGVGPMLQRRSQRHLLDEYRTEIRQAADEELSYNPDADVDLDAPAGGAAVAVLEIGDLEVLQVVVEGVGPQQTRKGPGHVPGTAGLGQPGNSGVVARRTAFGAPFGDLASLKRGDEILVTTTQGQSLYEVRTVRTGKGLPGDVYGPTEDEDRLTLVTSDSSLPWARGEAVVVVAELDGQPFEPTAQSGRHAETDGRGGDSSGLAPLALAALAYLLAVGVALALYRTSRPRSAYLLTAPPMLATVVLFAEGVARLLPAWS